MDDFLLYDQAGANVPTLSEWGMLIMGLLLLTIATVAVVRRKKAALSKAAWRFNHIKRIKGLPSR